MSTAIAIDGPAASGKSTIAKEVAARLGINFVNSGAMYRALTWKVVQEGIDAEEADFVIAVMNRTVFEFGVDNGVSYILVDGQDPGDELNSEEVNQTVSSVAKVPEVRTELVDRQRKLLKAGSLVMEGRDIGSAVFPDTPYKLFITASPEVRAARRAADGQVDAILKRDKQDRERKVSPLVVPDGAIEIDSSDMDVEQTVAAALAALAEQGLNPEQL